MAGEFGPDGTQALPPLPVYPDALSGLAAASMTDPASWSEAFADVPDTVVPPPVQPLSIDHEQVRAVVRREVARDRTRHAAPPAPLPPAPGLQRTRTAPTIGAPAARGLPPVPDAVQQTQRKNAAAGCIGCALVMVMLLVAFVAVVIIAGTHQ